VSGKRMGTPKGAHCIGPTGELFCQGRFYGLLHGRY
jgi:hypothetical protein